MFFYLLINLRGQLYWSDVENQWQHNICLIPETDVGPTWIIHMGMTRHGHDVQPLTALSRWVSSCVIRVA